MAEKTEEKTTPQGATIAELVTAIKENTGKDVEQQNLRATLRNMVKKGTLVHEPRTRWSFSDADVQNVVDHYNKADEPADEEKPKKKAPAKKSKAKKEEAEVEETDDDDDLELEDI